LRTAGKIVKTRLEGEEKSWEGLGPSYEGRKLNRLGPCLGRERAIAPKHLGGES
jgi:hypothetical protein